MLYAASLETGTIFASALPIATQSSLRAKRSNPFFLYAARWIASLRSQ